ASTGAGCRTERGRRRPALTDPPLRGPSHSRADSTMARPAVRRPATSARRGESTCPLVGSRPWKRRHDGREERPIAPRAVLTIANRSKLTGHPLCDVTLPALATRDRSGQRHARRPPLLTDGAV